MKHLLFYITFFSLSLSAHAQLGDPREKFSLSAEVEGGTNTDFKWKSTSGDELAGGRMKHGVNVKVRSSVQLFRVKNLSASLSPFYNYSNQDPRVEWGTENLGFTLPFDHHHYGGTLTLNYQMKAFGKPLTLIGMGTGNFSQYGYENASGMLGGMVAITRNQRTYLGLGAIYLLGTSVSWPLYPLIVYTHRFDNHWSIQCMETNNYLYYQATPRMKYSVGMELDTYRLYFRPKTVGLPEKAVISQVSERFGLFADWQATRELSFNLGVGATVPFYGRLRRSGYRHNYMTLRDHVKPFVKMRVKYSLTRSPK